jgi:two-component system, OmpR family, sensor kinase
MIWNRASRAVFGTADRPHQATFRFSNISRFREHAVTTLQPNEAPARSSLTVDILHALRRPWPLTARIPVVSGALSLVVAIVVSHVMMTTIAHEQELGVRRLAAVYIDGISTTIYPHIVARNIVNLTEALHRTMWFHQSMREQRALVSLPDGTLFADVSGPDADSTGDDPFHNTELRQDLENGNGLVFDAASGAGWASRTIVRNGNHVADLYVALDVKQLIEERRTLQRKLLVATVLAGFVAAALGFLIVRRMEAPVRLLTGHLKRAQAGTLEPVPLSMLPPASTEYGRLIRGYNDLVTAFREREALSARLAERERESVLGRLAATVAHEVRNPLGGMSTALDTVRKFGDDRDVRMESLDLIERGLWSIRDVVGSVLAFHRMPPDSRKLAPSDLEDLRHLIEPELRRRRLRLTWHTTVSTEVDVAATETRQIVLNLLLNACEASPEESEIGFSAQIRHCSDMTLSELCLVVVDGGPGLPLAVAAALMEVGVTDPHDPPRGLGIRVIRDLVRGLGGRIAAASASGDHGSRITVTLPLQSLTEVTL